MPRDPDLPVIHPSDLQLVRGALRREPAAIQILADRAACIRGFLQSRAQRLGMSLGSNTLDDLAQDTYLDLWRKLDTFRGDSKLETWACGFALNQLRRLRERKSLERRRQLELLEDPIHEDLQDDDLGNLVEGCLAELGPPVDEIIRLKHFENLTFEALAVRLGISPNTAKSHYYRGLSKLRDRLGPIEQEWTDERP